MRSIRFHKYLPLAFIYFFVNVPGFFPVGLMVTSILSPFMYLWLLLRGHRHVLEMFLAVTFPFIVANIYSGIIWKDFIITYPLMITVYVTIYSFAVAIREMRSWEALMRTIIRVNFVVALLGLAIRFTPYYQLMWQVGSNYEGEGNNLIRFRAFTYEAPYYSMLISPLVLYSFWRFIRKRNFANVRLLLATLFPLAMAASLGKILCLLCAIVAVHFYMNRGLAKYKWAFGVLIGVIVIYFALPSTSLTKQRIDNLMSGQDTSASLHTMTSYTAALGMARGKNIWFGVGFGETKNYAPEYLKYSNNQSTQNAPPLLIVAAVAETLAEFGIAGLVVRFGLQILFFFKTRPDRDPFRLSLFICVFLLQFGSSDKTYLPEYMLWILAFSPSVAMFSSEETVPESATAVNFVPQLT